MSDELILIILGSIFICMSIYIIINIVKNITTNKNKKNNNSKNIDKLLNMTTNKFAEILVQRLTDFATPDIKNLDLPENVVKEVIHSVPKYIYEMSMLILYYVYMISVAKNKQITNEQLLNFSIESTIPAMGIIAFKINDFDDEYKSLLENRLELYKNKTNYQIKNIFCNLCFEEIKYEKPLIKKNIPSDTISGMPIFIEHFNKVFENKKLYLFSDIVYMYIDYNRKKFENTNNIEQVGRAGTA